MASRLKEWLAATLDDVAVSRSGVILLAVLLLSVTGGLFWGLYRNWPRCERCEPAAAPSPTPSATAAASPAPATAASPASPTSAGSAGSSVPVTPAASPSPAPSPPPYTLKVISVTPASGLVGGGDLVTIKGSGFKGPTTVTFGGREGAVRTATDGESLAVVVPPHPAGKADVAVINADGKSDVLAGAYRYDCPPPADAQLLLIVVLAGALGGTLHALRSLYWYVGNRQLRVSWVLMYLTLPFSGAAVATVFFLVVRGGFMNTTPDHEVSTAIVGIAALVGLFSQQATLKLRDIANAVLTKPGEGDNSKPQASESVNGRRETPPAGTGSVTPAAPKLSPSAGSIKGGEQVTITGVGLSSVGSVMFGGEKVNEFQFDAGTATITLTTPSHAAGEVEVVITDAAGKSRKAKFTYTDP